MIRNKEVLLNEAKRLGIIPEKIEYTIKENSRGFLIELYYNDIKVGKFSNYLDEEGNQSSDIQINDEYQELGLGQKLLTLGIGYSENIFGGYFTDVRGLTSAGESLHKALETKGIIKFVGLMSYSLTDQGWDNFENLQILQKKVLT